MGDATKIRNSFKERLKVLHTNYTDMGFVHCVDETDDYQEIMSGGIWDDMRALKKRWFYPSFRNFLS